MCFRFADADESTSPGTKKSKSKKLSSGDSGKKASTAAAAADSGDKKGKCLILWTTMFDRQKRNQIIFENIHNHNNSNSTARQLDISALRSYNIKAIGK